MESYVKNNISDITYQSELTLDILFLCDCFKMSRVKFADGLRPTTYVAIAP